MVEGGFLPPPHRQAHTSVTHYDIVTLVSCVDMIDKTIENVRSRLFCGVLYPFEDSTHENALICVKRDYQCLYIVHDRDLDENGNLKKPHVHFIVKFANARSLFSVADSLKIQPNYLEKCSSFKSYSLYMIHHDEPDKAQYLPEEVCGNLYTDFVECLGKCDNEGLQALKICNYIYDNHIISMKDLLKFVVSNGLYSVYRRNYTMFKDIKFEKDGKIF